MSGSRVFGHAVDVGGLGWVWYAKRGEQGRLVYLLDYRGIRRLKPLYAP